MNKQNYKSASLGSNSNGSCQQYSRKSSNRIREVSGTLQNGIQIKNIYSDLEDCANYSADISKLVKHTLNFQFLEQKQLKIISTNSKDWN